MDDPKEREIRAWMSKARNDLAAAERLLEGEQPLTDIVSYHCQQAAEKALKAYLILNDKALEKTHDLEMLLSICADYDSDFSGLTETAAVLNPYAVLFRYPTGTDDPTKEEALDALRKAQTVVEFVSARIGLP